MESFFIDPSVLPGGRKWRELCSTTVLASNSSASEKLREYMDCEASAFSGFVQVASLLLTYGAVIFFAAQLISNGSELLLLVDGLKKIVGSVVLPVLGAVPDGAIVFFSGLGENAQEKISVGVGALAGSTILLLTVPWFISTYVGRVSLLPDKSGGTYSAKPRLDPASNVITETGVESSKLIRFAGRIMIFSSISYLIVELPTFLSWRNTNIELKESHIAKVALAMCLSFLSYYVWTQFTGSLDIVEYLWRKRTVREIQIGNLSVSDAFEKINLILEDADISQDNITEQSPLTRQSSINFDVVLKTFYTHYDYNKDGNISVQELSHLMKQMGEKISENELNELITEVTGGEDSEIKFDGFRSLMTNYLTRRRNSLSQSYLSIEGQTGQVQVEEDVYGSDMEEEPSFIRKLKPAEKKKAIMGRAALMMTGGSILILIFSDPAVTVMQDFAERLGVSAFYVSFILAPFASNFVEVLAAYNYARKKTRQSIEVSLTNLLGAAILNNTFVLAVFMILIIFKGLKWTFDVETGAILMVQCVVFIISCGQTYSVLQGIVILSLYPISILLIARFKS